MAKWWSATAVVLCLMGTAGALETGHELIQACQDKESPVFAVCAAYVKGILDGYQMSVRFIPDHQRPICTPTPGVEVGSTIDLIGHWLLRNPDAQSGTARNAIFQAMAAAYPCHLPPRGKW
jgi:Rap1a immunity proteins